MTPETEGPDQKRKFVAQGVSAHLLRCIAILVGFASRRPAVAARAHRPVAPTAYKNVPAPAIALDADLAYLSLKECAKAPEKFHDLAAVLGMEKQNDLHSFAESLRAKELVALYIKRDRPYTKINEQGIKYLKTLERAL